MKPARKKMWIAIAAVAGLAIFLILIKGLQIFTMISAGKKMTPPPETVTSAIVKEEDWAPMLSAVGSVSAVQGAVVSTELGGMVSEIGFQNGTLAKKGDLLVKLDASQEEALLRSAEAEVELARTDLERTRDLASKKVVSNSDLDAAQSKFRCFIIKIGMGRDFWKAALRITPDFHRPKPDPVHLPCLVGTFRASRYL